MNRGKQSDIEQYLSTGELMDVLYISRSTVNRLVKRGMPHIWVGAVRRFPLGEILDWLKEGSDKRRIDETHRAARN